MNRHRRTGLSVLLSVLCCAVTFADECPPSSIRSSLAGIGLVGVSCVNCPGGLLPGALALWNDSFCSGGVPRFQTSGTNDDLIVIRYHPVEEAKLCEPTNPSNPYRCQAQRS